MKQLLMKLIGADREIRQLRDIVEKSLFEMSNMQGKIRDLEEQIDDRQTEIDYEALADEINLADLAQELNINTSDVAEEIDLGQLAEAVNEIRQKRAEKIRSKCHCDLNPKICPRHGRDA